MIKIAAICDSLTGKALGLECDFKNVTPRNFVFVLCLWRPDVLLVESAWSGFRDSWKFKIASYVDDPNRKNSQLALVLRLARKLGIPCAFWNKEDGVHFDRFIDSAKLFDTVFTVDESCIPRYREALGNNARIESLPFAVQPRIHYPTQQLPKYGRTSFVGSYSHHIHDERRQWQDMMFRTFSKHTVIKIYSFLIHFTTSIRKNPTPSNRQAQTIDAKLLTQLNIF